MEEKFSLQDIKSRILKDSEGISSYINVSIEEMDWLVEMVEQQQQEIERLKEAEFKACSKHHEFIEEIETLEKDINMIKDLAVACDADERAIQPYEILSLLNTR